VNWNAIAAVGETVSAVAVLATLLYLAQQVRQTRREQQIAAVRANRGERRQYFESFRDSPYIPAILMKLSSGERLSPEEELRLRLHCSTTWGLLYSEWVHSQLETAGSFATSIDFNVELALGLPGMVDWFEEYGSRLYPAEFGSYVSRIQRAGAAS